MTLKVHGMLLSPWVRRLVAFIEEKGLSYELINVVPLGEPDPEFLKISPLGKVPVLEVDGRFLPDSLAACAYLEKTHSDSPLFPSDAWDLGWMHWLSDYLATGLFSKVEAPLFIQRFVNPNFLQMEPDPNVIEEALKLMPKHYNYLQGQLKDGRPYFLGESANLVDLTAGSIFINLLHAGEPVDADQWPELAAYVTRVLERPSFKRILELEKDSVGEISPLFAA